MLEWARRRDPNRDDREQVARLAARVIRDLDEEPPINLAVVASYRDIADIRVEDIRSAASLTPEPHGFVMRLRIVEVVPLVGEQHAVRLRLAQLVGKTTADMLVVVRIGIGQCR